MLALSDTCRAAIMGHGGLCACLSPSALGHLRAIAGDVRIEAGQTLFQTGHAADALFGVRHGAVMLSRSLDGHRRQILSFHFSGDMLGFAAEGRHHCTATALGRASLCRIPLAELDQDLALQRHVHGILARNVGQALDMQVRLGRMNAAERVRSLLNELCSRLGGGRELHLPMRIAEMADYLGLRPETVSREMSALRQAGLVGSFSPDGVLAITDPTGL
ncbi:Crp/Fnr family transcriptional regulator [Magnetospirillum sulfuroxidans]|uniref:Helix-turn-helix domain-containing protein n=1 Tax=Magnetospirillum sulfuroxidans TaxID=611300 RepID=A0ABS5I7I0_9PROT|nr:helix-turn-helix domain-containing protein [Magnetospirillum sulfuroxidans]MBR9970092.1 helix-turn-helix domain-containing protein [Magnetospirillum sulfuroxidans]